MGKVIILTPTCRFKNTSFPTKPGTALFVYAFTLPIKPILTQTGNDSFTMHDFIMKKLIIRSIKYSFTE